MPSTTPARSTSLTLDEVIARLAAREVVDGLVLVGSTGTAALRPESDYDLLVVLSQDTLPLSLACTWIDHRFAELIFTTAATVDRLLSTSEPVRDDSAEGALVSWLLTGRVVFDRTGRLQRAGAILRQGDPIRLNSAGETYRAWFTVSYNVQQTKRYLSSADPLYAATVDVRLLYGIHEVFIHYFRVRQIPWHGDKDAIHYLTEHDPAFLGLFQQCVAATDRERKVCLYEQLAQAALAPVGPLWGEGQTCVQFRGEVDAEPAAIDAALDFVNDLLAQRD